MTAPRSRPRSQEEILEQIEKRQARDPLGFEWQEYVLALKYEHAKPYLKDGVTEDEWSPETPEETREKAVDYMEFAWGKAINCRGISAWRSLAHYQAWLWLLGDENLWPTLESYSHYGKPQLRLICEWLDLDPDQWDDGVRVNSEEELYEVSDD